MDFLFLVRILIITMKTDRERKHSLTCGQLRPKCERRNIGACSNFVGKPKSFSWELRGKND